MKLYLDGNISPKVAQYLRMRNYDVKSAIEENKTGASDMEQLRFAIREERAIVTFDVADFARIHKKLSAAGIMHNGIIISSQTKPIDLAKRLLRLLSKTTEVEMMDQLRWI